MMEILYWRNRRRTFHNIALSPEEWCSLRFGLDTFDTNPVPLLTISPSSHFGNLIIVLILRFSVGPISAVRLLHERALISLGIVVDNADTNTEKDDHEESNGSKQSAQRLKNSSSSVLLIEQSIKAGTTTKPWCTSSKPTEGWEPWEAVPGILVETMLWPGAWTHSPS